MGMETEVSDYLLGEIVRVLLVRFLAPSSSCTKYDPLHSSFKVFYMSAITDVSFKLAFMRQGVYRTVSIN